MSCSDGRHGTLAATHDMPRLRPAHLRHVYEMLADIYTNEGFVNKIRHDKLLFALDCIRAYRPTLLFKRLGQKQAGSLDDSGAFHQRLIRSPACFVLIPHLLHTTPHADAMSRASRARFTESVGEGTLFAAPTPHQSCNLGSAVAGEVTIPATFPSANRWLSWPLPVFQSRASRRCVHKFSRSPASSLRRVPPLSCLWSMRL